MFAASMIESPTMKLPRVRFTLRKMMAAVAVLALILWTGRLLSLSAMYRDRALKYAAEDLGAAELLMGPRERPRVFHPPSARLLWARKMANKYQRAAWCPWLPVEPDSPPPR